MNREPKLQDYLDVIVRRRWLVVVCVVVATLGALITSLTLPKVYEARVKFKLDLSETKPVFLSELQVPQRIDPVDSELEIIKSRTLARIVTKKLALNVLFKNHGYDYIDSLGTAEQLSGRFLIRFANGAFTLVNGGGSTVGQGSIGRMFDNGELRFLVRSRPPSDIEFTVVPVERAIEDILPTITATQIKNTDLVLLKAKSYRPDLAAKIANTLAAEYIGLSLSVLRESARGSKEFIESQIMVFGEELDKAEEKLRSYKEQAGIFLLDETAKEIIDASAEFEVEREKAVVELHETRSSITKLEGELSKDEATYGAYKRMASFPTLSTSPIIVSLRNQLQDLEIRRQELLLDHAVGSKAIQSIDAEIKDLETEIARATQQIMLAGPSVSDPIFLSIVQNIINNETRVIALQSRIDALDRIISRQNYRLKQLPDAEVSLAQLEREKKANEEIYTMLLSKLEESKIAEAIQMTSARVIDYATVPDQPVEPKKRQNTILGFLLGMLIGVGGAFLLEYLDTSIKSAKDLEDLTGLSVLASIPLIRDAKPMDIPTIREPHSAIAEAYRILRTNLKFSAAARPFKSILITSTQPQEGKTTTCINLGIMLAQQGHKVILLDCDFRRPMFQNYFKDYVSGNHRGLADVLINRLSLSEAIVKNSQDNLYLVTSGTTPANPSELLGSTKMQDLVESLKKEYDFILIDAPPVLGVADARVLGRVCDGILLVVRSGKTNRDSAVEVKEELERAGEKVIGYVMNGVDFSLAYYRHRYYYYATQK